jgi:hypothetical protein
MLIRVVPNPTSAAHHRFLKVGRQIRHMLGVLAESKDPLTRAAARKWQTISTAAGKRLRPRAEKRKRK